MLYGKEAFATKSFKRKEAYIEHDDREEYSVTDCTFDQTAHTVVTGVGDDYPIHYYAPTSDVLPGGVMLWNAHQHFEWMNTKRCTEFVRLFIPFQRVSSIEFRDRSAYDG